MDVLLCDVAYLQVLVVRVHSNQFDCHRLVCIFGVCGVFAQAVNINVRVAGAPSVAIALGFDAPQHQHTAPADILHGHIGSDLGALCANLGMSVQWFTLNQAYPLYFLLSSQHS